MDRQPISEESQSASTQTETHLRYCKYCGEIIDRNKKCTKCGKQYFHISSFKLLAIFAFLITIAFGISISTLIQQKEILDSQSQIVDSVQVKLQSAQSDFKELETNYEIAQNDLSNLIESVNETSEELHFYENNAVIVTENGEKYHKYGCWHITNKRYWIFNTEAAKGKGYTACSDCWTGAALINEYGVDTSRFIPVRSLADIEEARKKIQERKKNEN